jgi:hypothetical protein
VEMHRCTSNPPCLQVPSVFEEVEEVKVSKPLPRLRIAEACKYTCVGLMLQSVFHLCCVHFWDHLR